MTQVATQIHSQKLVKHAISLLSQQCWCWGQDILRPEGNWLLVQGFERIPPPPKLADRGSVYQMWLPDQSQLILRGFGVFLGQPEVGGIFLPRFEFLPLYTPEPELTSPPWSKAQLPPLKPLHSDNQTQCATLMHRLLDWLTHYEADVVQQLGLAYREKTLRKWNEDRNASIPAEEFSAAWAKLKQYLGQSLEGLQLP